MHPDVLTISYSNPKAPTLFENSLKNTGFAIIKNHSIETDLINRVYDEWNSYFSSDSKMDFIFDEEKQDGYFPYLTENAKGSASKDLKEFYHIYPWGRIPDIIGSSTMTLYNQLTEVASTLLGWIESCAPTSVTKLFSISLKNMIKDSRLNLFRVIHYPPMTGNEKQGAIRAAPHEDINLLTVLVAGSQPGLQVLDMNGKWHNVSIDKDTIVVNSGDMLKMASGNYYPSTTHRVVNPNPTLNVSRYSMPLFLHPSDEVILDKEHTAGSYLKERLKEIGLI